MPLLAHSAEPLPTDRSPSPDSPNGNGQAEKSEVLRLEPKKESKKAARKREKLEKKLAKIIRKEGLKTKKKEKKKKKKTAEKSASTRSADLIMDLRRERDEREAVEREKARQAVLEASGRLKGYVRESESRDCHILWPVLVHSIP